MSEVRFKYLAGNSEEVKELEEALIYFARYLRFNTNKDNQILFVESTSHMIKTLENKFMDLNKTKGISIYPEKDNQIRGIYKEYQDWMKTSAYPIFHFNSSKEGLSIGIQPTEDKKYLFEVYYEKPNSIK